MRIVRYRNTHNVIYLAKFEGVEELFTRFTNQESNKNTNRIMGIELVVQFILNRIVHAVNMHQSDTWPQSLEICLLIAGGGSSVSIISF